MSKRFGRNQKRKLKARVAELEQVAVREQRCQRYARSLEQNIQSWATRIENYFGIHSSLNRQPKEVVTNGELRQVPIPESITDYLSQRTMADSIKVEFMHRFCTVVEEIPHEYKYLIKLFEIDDNEKRVYYSVSRTEFDHYGLQDEFIRYLSEKIANDLTRLLNSSRAAA